MAEVQSHGNDFEDLIIKELTGKTKKEYDSLKGKDGYTSAMDIVRRIMIHLRIMDILHLWIL